MSNRGIAGGAMLALAVGLSAPAHADHHVHVHWSADLGAGFDDNVGNAGQDVDVRDSAVYSAGLNLDYTRLFSLNTKLLLRAAAQGEHYAEFDRLSGGRLLGMARLSHRPTGGFYMPTFATWLSAALLETSGTLRDGAEYRGGVFLSEPLTTAISARLGVSAVERQSDSDVFELSSWSAGLNLDWRLASWFTLYGGYQFHDGDIVSTASVAPKSSHIPGGGGGSLAADPDDAIEGLFAYRIDATTQVGTIGFNVPLSSRLALDGQLLHADSETEGGDGYERWQGVVSVLTRF